MRPATPNPKMLTLNPPAVMRCGQDELIKGILVRGKSGVIAGPPKSLKTNICLDLALSLAEGGSFLGKFKVLKPVRTGILLGKSDLATIQETARRIARSKGKSLSEFGNAIFSIDVPQRWNAALLEALRCWIESRDLEAVIIDLPTYSVGPLGDALEEMVHRTSCTVLQCLCVERGLANPLQPMHSNSLGVSGFGRQSIQLGHRQRYDSNQGGHHELWMSVGGIDEHNRLWSLTIDEGTLQIPGGRFWKVGVTNVSQEIL